MEISVNYVETVKVFQGFHGGDENVPDQVEAEKLLLLNQTLK